MKFKINCKASKDDPEKLVTPGIVWVNVEEDYGSGYGVFIGWWHWSIGILWGFKKKQ